MDHSAVGQLIASRMRERRQKLASSVQPPIEAPFQLAYQKLQADLCGDESAFDFTGPSLQNRLLDYLEKEFKPTDGICMLQAAERSRQLLRDSVWKAVATGLHAGNKELWPLVTGFSDFELFVLEQIVTDSNPAKRLAQPEAIAIVLRKLAHSDGVNLVTYLAKRLELQNSRRPTA